MIPFLQIQSVTDLQACEAQTHAEAEGTMIHVGRRAIAGSLSGGPPAAACHFHGAAARARAQHKP